MILSWGNTTHPNRWTEVQTAQNKCLHWSEHGSRVQAKLGIWIAIISKHFTATKLSVNWKKNNNMLMNYKSAKNHAYVLNSKFLRKWWFAKKCIIRAVTRNIHIQQVTISATSHVLTIKDLILISLYIKNIHRFQVYRPNFVRKIRFGEKRALLNQCTSVTLYVSIHKIRNASNISKYRLLQYGGPQVHPEFQQTLLILKHTPDSNNSLLILKVHP